MNKESSIYYPVIFHPEEVGYSVSVPDLDGCFTQGDSLEAAIKMAVEAISLYLDGEKAYPPASEQSCIEVAEGDILIKIPFSGAN